MTKTIKTIKLVPTQGIKTSVSAPPALGVRLETLYLYNAAAINQAIEQINTSEAETLKNATNAEKSAKDAAASARSSAESAQGAFITLNTVKEYAAAIEEAVETANTYAETAQASDVAANAAMLEAQSAATAAAQSAEKTKQNEELLQGYVDTAQNAASTATSNATSAKSSADAAAVSQNNAAQSEAEAAAAKTAAQAAQTAAQTAKDTAQQSAATATNAAETAQAAQTAAENAQSAAEDAQSEAEANQGVALNAASAAKASETASANAAGYAQSAAEDAQQFAQSAEQYKQVAAEKAAAAQSEADRAAQSAANAANSAQAAAASESNAQTSMDDAAVYANAAATSASNAAGYAGDAQIAQSAAETAASNAATSEQNAAQSASGAKSSADAANDSKTSAANSAAAAAQSEQTATEYATNAQTAATNASASAEKAQSQKTAAQAAAQAASASQTAAATSESNAADYATNAQTAQSAAETAAANAATSEQNAAASATSASNNAAAAAQSAKEAQDAVTAGIRPATSEQMGGVIVGETLKVEDGKINLSDSNLSKINDTATDVENIKQTIPENASPANQLATKVDLTDCVKNTDYASTSKGGVFKTSQTYGTEVDASGSLYGCVETVQSLATRNNHAFISKGTLENIKNDIVKRAVTENDITLTDEEKTAAQDWLGIKQGASLPILTVLMSDHVLNDMSWLRADTFSWQSGDAYKAAYEHLTNDVTYIMYAWSDGSYDFYTLTDTPAVGDDVYFTSKNYGTTKVLSVSNDTITFEHHRTGETTTATRNPSSDTNALAYGLNNSTETIGDITIAYYQADDGHKICLPDQESNIVALHEKTGAADYYLLDTTNKQFKLPRKQKRRLIQAVNNADGTWYNLYSDGWVEQGGFDAAVFNDKTFTFPMEMKDTGYALTLGYGYGNIGGQNGKFGITGRTTTGFSFSVISLSGNATGANMSWNVSGYAAESAYASAGIQLEYYYVGNFEQTAIEQTAGINTELFNGKADRDLGNIPTNYDYVVESQMPTEANGYTWYRKYKSGWVEQGGKVGALNNSRITVTLPVAMANNSYVAIATGQNASSASDLAVAVISPTTTQITLGSNANYGNGATWQVSGMSAQ